MLNFLSNVFHDKISPRNLCSETMDTIQACLGCDGECTYSCDAICANQCRSESQDSTDPPTPPCPDCRSDCSGLLQPLIK